MNRRPLVALAFVAFLASARVSGAQPLAAGARGAALPPPLTVSFVEGRVDIARTTGVEAAATPEILDEGDRLVVGAGRAELVDDDGTLVHADHDTDLWAEPGPRLRLVRGRLVIHTSVAGNGLTLATPAGLVHFDPAGAYDLTARDLDGDTVIAVLAGRGTYTGSRETLPLSPDDVLTLDPRAPVARWGRGVPADDFRAWSTGRADRTTLARAAATLPPAVQPWMADLAANGTWSTLPEHGPVWFPSAGPAWRPYTLGTWRFTRRGWTWMDGARWGWPVHHYGRWGRHATRGWYWIPQRQWAPAWVGWAIGPDHIAWSPLGWNSRPLVDFHAGAALGPGGLWGATWAIAPRRVFGRRSRAMHPLEDPMRLPGPVLGGFVSQLIGPRGPAGPGDAFAVPPSFFSPQTLPPPAVYAPRPPSRVTDAPRDEPGAASWRRPMDAPGRQVMPLGEPADQPAWASEVSPSSRGVERQPQPVGPHGTPGAVHPTPAAPPAISPPSGRAAGAMPGRRPGTGASVPPSPGRPPRREDAAPETHPPGPDTSPGSRPAGVRRDPGLTRGAAQPRGPRG